MCTACTCVGKRHKISRTLSLSFPSPMHFPWTAATVRQMIKVSWDARVVARPPIDRPTEEVALKTDAIKGESQGTRKGGNGGACMPKKAPRFQQGGTGKPHMGGGRVEREREESTVHAAAMNPFNTCPRCSCQKGERGRVSDAGPEIRFSFGSALSACCCCCCARNDSLCALGLHASYHRFHDTPSVYTCSDQGETNGDFL